MAQTDGIETLEPAIDDLAVFLRERIERRSRWAAELEATYEATGLILPEGMSLGGLIKTLETVQEQLA